MNPFYINTQVEIEKWYAEQTDLGPVRTALYIAVDSHTGVKECSIYTDDEKGNGTLVLKFSLD